jgi:hypothetical protein
MTVHQVTSIQYHHNHHIQEDTSAEDNVFKISKTLRNYSVTNKEETTCLRLTFDGNLMDLSFDFRSEDGFPVIEITIRSCGSMGLSEVE